MLDFASTISQIPPVTKTILSLALLFKVLEALKLVSLFQFTCGRFEEMYYNWQYYRIFTCFLIFAPGITGIIDAYNVYHYSISLEKGKFQKHPENYILYFVIVLPLIIFAFWGMGFPYHLFSMGSCLGSCVMLTWVIQHPHDQVNFNFITIPAMYLPAARIAFAVLFGGKLAFFADIISMGTAYIYNCLETKSFGPLMLLFVANGSRTFSFYSRSSGIAVPSIFTRFFSNQIKNVQQKKNQKTNGKKSPITCEKEDSKGSSTQSAVYDTFVAPPTGATSTGGNSNW
ncbi:unnamed protein product [Ambrosiozyma monospora]|uniref:Derlin n=1 Tax=Ambrosiozyma monospora TaxID=43982 RepID=A0A9W6Z122_AMBMO|nr:unnamed protein product [Ambrosiozyma monospora]